MNPKTLIDDDNLVIFQEQHQDIVLEGEASHNVRDVFREREAVTINSITKGQVPNLQGEEENSLSVY